MKMIFAFEMLILFISMILCSQVNGFDISFSSSGSGKLASTSESFALDNSALLNEELSLNEGTILQSREFNGLGNNSINQRILGSNQYHAINQIDSNGPISAATYSVASADEVKINQALTGSGDISFAISGNNNKDSSVQSAYIDEGTISSSQSISIDSEIFADQSTTASGNTGNVQSSSSHEYSYVDSGSTFSGKGTLSADISSSASKRIDISGSVILTGNDLSLGIGASEESSKSNYNLEVEDEGRGSSEILKCNIIAHAGSPKITGAEVEATGDSVKETIIASNQDGEYISSLTQQDVSSSLQSSQINSVAASGITDQWRYQGTTPIPYDNRIQKRYQTSDGTKYASDSFWIDGTSPYDIQGSVSTTTNSVNIFQTLNAAGILTTQLGGGIYISGRGWLPIRTDTTSVGQVSGWQSVAVDSSRGYVSQDLLSTGMIDISCSSSGFPYLSGRPFEERPYSSADAQLIAGSFEAKSTAQVYWNTFGSELIEKTKTNIDVSGQPRSGDLSSESSYQGDKAKATEKWDLNLGSVDARIAAETAKSANAEAELTATGWTYNPSIATESLNINGQKMSGLEYSSPSLPIFYRLYNPNSGDHFYTSDTNEVKSAKNYGYVEESWASQIYSEQRPDTIALHRMYNQKTGDHFYTSDINEVTTAKKLGYLDEGNAGYIYNSQKEGTVPLYRLFNSAAGDHFYTEDANLENAMRYGYKYEGIAGYLPSIGEDKFQGHLSSYAYPENNHHSKDEYNSYGTAGIYGMATDLTLDFSGNDVKKSLYFAANPSDQVKIPLYRAYSPITGDHFYTTDVNREGAFGSYGFEGITGYISKTRQDADMVPLYRMWNYATGDHFYTADSKEYNNAVSFNYVKEGIVGYVYPSTGNAQNDWSKYGGKDIGTPLYRLCNGKDHFYTTSFSEAESSKAYGYVLEGITGYIDSIDSNKYQRIIRSNDLENQDSSYYLWHTIPERSAVPEYKTPWGIRFVSNRADYSNAPTYFADNSAWRPSGGENVDIAIIDSGVDTFSPDLVMRVAEWSDSQGKGEAGSDANDLSWVDDSTVRDPTSHGTHVAGTMVADGGIDGKGIWGMAPQADLLVYKLNGNWNNGAYNLEDQDIINAIYRSSDLGAEIISMSLGNSNNFGADSAISYAKANDVIVIASAGNLPLQPTIGYPARNSNVLAVGNININLQHASDSSPGFNTGDTSKGEVTFAAPGTDILSTIVTVSGKNQYDEKSGTSMAAPHISGLAAKYWSDFYYLNPSSAAIVLKMKGSLVDISPAGEDNWSGLGAPRYNI